MDARIIKREKHARDDGFLVELFSEKYSDFDAVHSYLVFVAPGKTRAGHYHKEKIEVIFPVNGKVTVLLKDTEHEERKEVILDPKNDEYSALLIPANIAHLVKNDSKENAQIVVFSDSMDLEDTYQCEVEK